MPLDHQYAPHAPRRRGMYDAAMEIIHRLLYVFPQFRPNQSQIGQNRAKSRQAQTKFLQRKKLGFPWIGFAVLSLFRGLS
jgi:hypothetical protein